MSLARDPRHPGEAAGVLVLLVRLQAVFLADLIEEFHSLAVLLIVWRVDVHDGVERFAAGVDQGGDGQLQLPQDGVLLPQLRLVRFHQGEAQIRHVVVSHALAVQGIEADPGAGLGIWIPQHRAQVAAAAFELGLELARRPVEVPSRGKQASVLVPDLGHIAHVLIIVEEHVQVGQQLLSRVPGLRLPDLHLLHPALLHHHLLVSGADGVAPVQLVPGGSRAPAPLLCHLHQGPRRDGHGSPLEAVPLAEGLSRVIAPRIPAAPLVPDGAGIARLLQRKAHGQPLGVVHLPRIQILQQLVEIQIVIVCCHAPPSVLVCSFWPQ